MLFTERSIFLCPGGVFHSWSSMDLREIEKTKIQCARKFFEEMNWRFVPENLRYDVVDSFGKLMELVK